MLTALSIGRGGLGRAGNQMWTIAGVIGIAIKSGQPYGFPPWRVVDALNFGSKEDIDVYRYLKNPLPEIPEGVHFRDYGYTWGYHDINLPMGNWNLDCHFQSMKYWDHCQNKIREAFRFKDEPEQNDYVAIHYRAGDYTEGKGGHHPRLTREYYHEAIKQFPDGTHFILFSDTRKFSEISEIVPKELIDYCRVHSFDYIQDFKMMKKCKSFITANSSFSSFAAALGEHPDKIVIQPTQWFGDSMPDLWRLNTSDLYHPNAIVI